MEPIGRTIQIVEKIEQNSLMLTDRDSKDSINSLKDEALLKLGEIKSKTNHIEYSKVYKSLEQKLVKSISKIESFL
ncbi:hypothetical protein [Aquimarina algiphila]|uniref:hypothetical protein n=1 Tax=Aquimarina algiphila TaxID=2047982 RepID=UPI00232B5740|nr:hypothetical protein [Aquimarina algiphila]